VVAKSWHLRMIPSEEENSHADMCGARKNGRAATETPGDPLRVAVPYSDTMYTYPDKYYLTLAEAFWNCNRPDVRIVKLHANDLLTTTGYDAVFLIGSFTAEENQLERLAKSGVLLCLWHDDLHAFKYRMAVPSKVIAAWAEVAGLVFVPYLDLWERWEVFRRNSHKVVWLPKSVPEWIFDCGLPWADRQDRVLISGFSSCVYPLRRKIFRLAAQPSSVVESLQHSGYGSQENVVGRDYFRFVGSYRAAAVTTVHLITGLCRPLRYTVAKYFEIPACGCLPFMEKTPDLGALGFTEGEHYVEINDRNFERQFARVHSAEAPQMAASARRLVLERHTHAHRVETVLSEIKKRIGVYQ
jgi:hypothetical protein